MGNAVPQHTRVLRRCLTAVALVASLCLPPCASADSLFLDDFEGYAPGSNLIGQGGWSGGTTGGINAMYVGPGSSLPGMVLDGRDWTGPLNNIHFAGHALSGALDPLAITVLSFDAFAVSAWPPSTNSGVGFGVGAPTDPAVTVPVYWDVQFGSGWGFAYMGVRTVIPDSYDTAVHLSIVVDGPAGEIFGLYEAGGVVTATPHFAIAAATIASLDYASLFIDYQGGNFGADCAGRADCRLGPEIDNISVATVVPEPASLLLLGTGLLGLCGWMTRRR